MKIIFLLLTVFTLLSSNAQNIVSGKVTYEIMEVHLEHNGKNTDINTMLEMAKRQQYQLVFNKNYTSFLMLGVMDNEVYNDFYNNLAKNFVSYSDLYYDYKNNKIIEKVLDGTLLQQKIPDLLWQISSESKMIDKYQCYKATYSYDYQDRAKKTKSRTVTAWFAPSLPYSFGPKQFHGLPGLILQLSDHTVTFLATKIELLESDTKINIPVGKLIEKTEFERAVLRK